MREKMWSILFFIFLFACSSYGGNTILPEEKFQEPGEGERQFHQGYQLYLAGNDLQALQIFRQIIENDPENPFYDRTLYLSGLIFASHAIEEKDPSGYEKALKLFIRLVEEQNTSPLVPEATVWIGMIKKLLSHDSLFGPKQSDNEPVSSEKQFQSALDLYQKGDFQNALQQLEPLLNGEGGNLYDRSLYLSGLIWVTRENSGHDDAKAHFYFSKLVQERPESFFSAAAKAWIAVLDEINEINGKMKKMQEALAKSRRNLKKLEDAVQRMKEVDIDLEERANGLE